MTALTLVPVVDTPALVLVGAAGVLGAVGTTLLLERSLTRILLGVVVLSNGINLIILAAGGAAGSPPNLGRTGDAAMADPLPQAMVLTAIVITLGVTAFLLAMAYRSWQLDGNDEVRDDAEDRRILHAGTDQELRAQIRQQRREMRHQIRQQRRELRARIRSERERLARAEDDDLRGTS